MINLTKEQITDMMLFTHLKDEKDLTAVVRVKDLMQHYKDDSVTVDIEAVTEIPKDYVYDTETDEFFCYRNKYTGEEIHIIKSPKTYVLERPQGKWIAREDMNFLDENKVWHFHFMCEKCKFIHDFIDGHTSQYNFCPNCGADMGEGEE